MRWLLVALVVTMMCLGWQSAALAQQLGSTVVAPAFRTGAFGGLTFGHGWTNTSTVATLTATSHVRSFGSGDYNAGDLSSPTSDIFNSTATNFGADSSSVGWVPGAFLGANTVVGPWLFGFEADLQSVNQSTSATACAVSTCLPNTAYVRTQADLRWVATFRGRAGFLLNPGLLLYGTGGLALGNASVSLAQGWIGGFENSASTSGVRTGIVFGGGIEQMLTRNLSLRAEFLSFDFGTLKVASGPISKTTLSGDSDTVTVVDQTTSATARAHLTEQILRVGLIYVFN